MRLIANYQPLGGMAVGDEQMLWGTLCAIADIGTEDSPKLVFVADVADKEEAEAMVACGRFQAAAEQAAAEQAAAEQAVPKGKAGKADQ